MKKNLLRSFHIPMNTLYPMKAMNINSTRNFLTARNGNKTAQYQMLLVGAALFLSLFSPAWAQSNALDGNTNVPAAAKRDATKEWKLVWSDEFNKDGLPDPAKWDYETGFVRNGEQQYYTRARMENARVENGMLVIEGRKEKFKNDDYKPDSKKPKEMNEYAEYTAASLITLNKASWKYGKIEVRAKVPKGRGAWPAIWTLGENCSVVKWPKCGEIDILEFWGRSPGEVTSNFHFAGKNKNVPTMGRLAVPKVTDDFHTYAIELSESVIDVYFDGKKYHSFSVDEAGLGEENPFRKPQYLLLNLAMGGRIGGPIDEASLPQKFLIDYVRVYSRSL